MDLTLERPGDHLYIRSVSEAGIRVVDETVEGSLILSATEMVTDWEVSKLEQLNEQRLEPVFALQPEVVLLGTGSTQVFPEPELMMCFHRRGVGIEVMATAAACRTFNVLVSERRNVVAALLPPGA
jgi:uncharacterized protein